MNIRCENWQSQDHNSEKTLCNVQSAQKYDLIPNGGDLFRTRNMFKRHKLFLLYWFSTRRSLTSVALLVRTQSLSVFHLVFLYLEADSPTLKKNCGN